MFTATLPVDGIAAADFVKFLTTGFGQHEVFDALVASLMANERAYEPAWANGTGYFDGLETVTARQVAWFAFEDDKGRRALALETPMGTVVAFSRYSGIGDTTRVVICAGAQSRPLDEAISTYWSRANGAEYDGQDIWNLIVRDVGDASIVLARLKAIEASVRYALREEALKRLNDRAGS